MLMVRAVEFVIWQPDTPGGWLILAILAVVAIWTVMHGLWYVTQIVAERSKQIFFVIALLGIAYLINETTKPENDPLARTEVQIFPDSSAEEGSVDVVDSGSNANQSDDPTG